LSREPPFLGFPVLDELRARGVVLGHVVVVGRFLLEQSLRDEQVDRCARGVRRLEQRRPVCFAEEATVYFDAWMGSYDLQVERDPVGNERFSGAAQDVHDVLGLDSSERPGEDDDVVGRARNVELGRRPGCVCDTIGELGGQRVACSLDRFLVGVEGEHACRLLGDPERQAAVAAADLEDARAGEVGQAPQCGEMGSFRVELADHRGASN
jgi:hypothetical protein